MRVRPIWAMYPAKPRRPKSANNEVGTTHISKLRFCRPSSSSTPSNFGIAGSVSAPTTVAKKRCPRCLLTYQKKGLAFVFAERCLVQVTELLRSRCIRLNVKVAGIHCSNKQVLTENALSIQFPNNTVLNNRAFTHNKVFCVGERVTSD